MPAPGGIPLSSNFDVKTPRPLDHRIVCLDIPDRNSLSIVERYEGLICYVASDQTNYQLQGGVTNSDWVVIGAGWSWRSRFIREPTIVSYPVSASGIADNHYFDVDTTLWNVTFSSLPSIIDIEDGDEVTYRNIGTNLLIVNPINTEFKQWDALSLIRDGNSLEFLPK